MKKKKSKLSLTKAFEELENITRDFESGEIDLEEGIPKFKRGLELAKFLKKRLGEIENEIEEIKDDFKDIEKESEKELKKAQDEQEKLLKDEEEEIPF